MIERQVGCSESSFKTTDKTHKNTTSKCNSPGLADRDAATQCGAAKAASVAIVTARPRGGTRASKSRTW
jgi:hypothetical protein